MGFGKSIQNSKIAMTCEHLTFIDKLFDKRIKAELLYRGSEQKFNAGLFHSMCDLKGPTLTLVQSTKGKIFGGYTSMSWDKDKSYI